MISLKQSIATAWILVITLFITTACDQSTNLSRTTKKNGLTPTQILQKSSRAMKQLSSAHIVLQSQYTWQATKPEKGSATVTLRGIGDVTSPNGEQMQFILNQGPLIRQVVQGRMVYFQMPQGNWYAIDKSTLQQQIGSPLAGFAIDQNTILPVVQKARLTDHGIVVQNGQHLRHITASLNKIGARQLLNTNPYLISKLGQPNVDAALHNLQPFQVTINLWINEQNFSVSRSILDIRSTVHAPGNGNTSSATTHLNTNVVLSQFNQPVSITPPAHATRINNLDVI